MWKNFKNFHLRDCKILAFEIEKNLFLGPAKTWAVALHMATLV